MAKKLPTLEKRRRAVEATKDRFGGRAFKLGANDCVKLARFHLTKLGHKLPSTGHYENAREAVAALKKRGARNLADLLDKHLDRIPPAAMWIGDIGMPPAEPDEESASKLGTIVIKIAPSKFLGWHPEQELLAIMDISQIDLAWRA